jgi:hypothetical protein
MSDNLSTQKRTNQYGGNYSSSDYNSRIEENYQDLVYLYNKYNVIDKKIHDTFSRVIKDHTFISQAVEDLKNRLSALEAQEKMMSIYHVSQIDTARFASVTSLAIPTGEQLSFNSIYNYITLPYISASSFSTLKTFNSEGSQVVPDYIKFKVSSSSALDSAGAVIDTTPPYYSLYDTHDKVWSRSIISDIEDANGVGMYFYIQIPQNIPNQKINNIRFTPFPNNSVDILSIEYTKSSSPLLAPGDGYRPLNEFSLYNDDANAIGHVPPGGWTRPVNSDAIISSGPLYFNIGIPQTDNRPITAIRILMRQKNYFRENGKYVYTYGLSDLDIRVDKYMPQGRAFIKYEAPTDSLIYTIDSVSPKIYNVPLSLIDLCFSHRVFYPTSGGGYSETPQGGSSAVWVEVSLSQLDDGTVPVLSDLVIKYT